jgi:cell division septal protein FtsQ
LQQIGTIVTFVADKFLSLLPKISKPRFLSALTVRRKQRLRNIGVFCTLFVFPLCIVTIGYNYVQGRGGFLQAVSDFGHLELQQVNLTVYQGDKIAHRVDWRVDPESIKASLPIKVGTSMLDINPDSIRKVINDVAWVKSASVKLILPSTLNITVREQSPFALWQRDEMFYLIDETGAEITNQNLERYDYLPWVVGYGANTRIYEYAALMNDYSEIFKQVKSAYRVGNRRWTLVTHNDVEISLSEHNPRASLEQLINLQKRRNILNENISEIDLRIAGKTFVRPKGATTLSVYSGVNI